MVSEILLACKVKTQMQLLQLHEASLPGLTAIHTKAKGEECHGPAHLHPDAYGGIFN